MTGHTFNSSVQEVEVGRSLRVLRQPVLYRDPVSLKTNKQTKKQTEQNKCELDSEEVPVTAFSHHFLSGGPL